MMTQRDAARTAAVTALSYSRILGANDRIGLGVIGTGGRGTYVKSLFQKNADVEVRALPIDDAWMRDSGPIIVRAPDTTRHAVHFGFNAWGEKYAPYDQDAAIGARVARALGLPVYDAPFVLEGGSIAVDGAGILVTTERCLLNENRNPGMSKAEIEDALRHWLGVDRIVWLRDGIAEDAETDGHVDNVVAFVGPARVLLQGCADPDNPNHANAADNAARILAAARAAGDLVVHVRHEFPTADAPFFTPGSAGAQSHPGTKDLEACFIELLPVTRANE